MTTLKELYTALKSLRELGLPIEDKLLKAADELEEKIIKEEILPSLSENIQPLLDEIQRDLVLVVEYHPGEPISVALSRKVKISEIGDAKQLTPKPDRDTQEAIPNPRENAGTKGPWTGLCVLLPNGEIIQEKVAKDTMAKAIEKAGVEAVSALHISQDGANLVSRERHPRYAKNQVLLPGGYYLNTHSGTLQKQNHLKHISQALNLGWVVEIIDPKQEKIV